MTGLFRQAVVLVGVGLRAVPARVLSMLPMFLALAGAAAILVALFAVTEGFRSTLLAGADAGSVIVLRRGATSELVSALDPATVGAIRVAAGIAKRHGAPQISPELVLVVGLPNRVRGAPGSATLRGVGADAYALRERFTLTQGRLLRVGYNEVMVGTSAQRSFGGLELGASVSVAGESWPIVGVFETGGREDSELWGDATALQYAFRRGATVQTVVAKLSAPDALAQLQESLDRDPRLDVYATTQTAYYAEQAAALERVVLGLGSFLVVLMGAGALLAVLESAHASVDSRRQELATLRALGFSAVATGLATIVETLILSGVGGVLGVGCVALALDGVRASTLDFSGFTQVAFELDVSGAAAFRGIALATGLGATGGLIAGLRVMRSPIAVGLRG